jgi:3-hydroxyisobutyrate dehydrogenase-like beta-hydroxyacid dehydrogenase
MARRLVGAGHAVRVWNRTAATAEQLAGEEPRVAVSPDPASAVGGAAVVISMLATGEATEDVLLDPAVVAAVDPAAVVVDHGTSGAASARRLAAALAGAGRRFVDAPVSGSVPTVLAGQVLVMAAGAPGDVAAAEPVMSAYARRVTTVGEPGAGQVMKLAVNLVVHTLNAAVGEALVLAGRGGIAATDAYDVLEDSVVGAPFVKYKRSAFLEADPPVAMSVDLTVKDLSLIRALAADLAAPLPVTQAVAGLYADAAQAGRGAEDMASVTRFLAGQS